MKLFLSTSDDFADPMVASFHQIGLSVARGFEPETLDEPTKRGYWSERIQLPKPSSKMPMLNSTQIVNGWRYTMAGGRAGSRSRNACRLRQQSHRSQRSRRDSLSEHAASMIKTIRSMARRSTSYISTKTRSRPSPSFGT